MLRVLKPGGHFVISFPSGDEGLGLGHSLISHGVSGSGRGTFARLNRSMTAVLAGMVYLPLLLRTRGAPYTRKALVDMLDALGAQGAVIEEDPVYRDYIVSGTKTTGGSIA